MTQRRRRTGVQAAAVLLFLLMVALLLSWIFLRPAGPSWWPDRAVLAFDFADGRYMTGGMEVNEITAFGSAPRPFVDEWSGTRWGVRTDGAVVNLAPQDYASAAVKTAAGAGSLPGGWELTDLQFEVLEATPATITVRLFGTAATSGVARLIMGAGDQPAEPGAEYNISGYLQLIAGSASAGAIHIGSVEGDPAGGTPKFSDVPGNPTIPQTDVAFPLQATVVAEKGGDLRPQLTLIVGEGKPVDVTLQISRVQVSVGDQRMPFSDQEVPADDLELSNLPELPADFSLVALARAPLGSVSGTLVRLRSGDQFVEIVNDAYSLSVRRSGDGQEVSVPLGHVVPLLPVAASFEFAGGELSVRLSGKPPVSLGQWSGPIKQIEVGSGSAGAWGGAFSGLYIFKGAVEVSDIAALMGPAWAFDDFDRPDGGVNKPWLGPAYDVTGTAGTKTLSAGRVTATDSTQATTSAYFLMDMGAPVCMFGGTVIWQPGGSGGVIGLISTPNKTQSAASGITTASNHFLASPQGLFVGEFAQGELADEQYSMRLKMSADGTSRHSVVWWEGRGGAMIVRLPDGSLLRFAEPSPLRSGGRYAVAELFWDKADAARPEWVGLGAQACVSSDTATAGGQD